MDNAYAVGQRWISEPEPDMGLGTVVQIEKGRVQLLFPASGEMRTYASAGAPLKRVRFRVGDRITTHENIVLTVEKVLEEDHLLTYEGAGASIPESLLSDAISFHTAEDRLLSGQIDEPKAFALRRQTIELQHHQRESAVRGFIGGRIDLIPHQLYIAHEVSSRYAPRVLLSDEVGLGKTIEACLIVHRMLLSGRASRVLIVVPESLVHQWFVEMLRRFNIWLNIFDEERCEAIEGSAPDNNPFLDDQLILCSLDFLAGSEKRARQAVMAGWDILVVDEAHHLAWSVGQPSKEYLLIEALGQGSKGLLLLTATPEQLGVESHFARLRLLDPNRYNDFKAFQATSEDYREIASIIEKINSGNALTPGEIKAVESRFKKAPKSLIAQLKSTTKLNTEAKERLVNEILDLHGPGRVLFRNTRAGMSGFPKRIAHLAPITASNTDEQWLEITRREFAYDTDKLEKQPKYAFDNDPRMDWLLQFIQALDGAKVLLICRSKEKALALHASFRKRVNISAGIFHEDLTLVQRDRNAAWFADEDGARLLICSEIGSEGRNFQFAHHLVLFDLPLNPELLEQRIGRLDRIGQKENINVHIPYLKGSPQELLTQWYHEGLNAFERNLVGSSKSLAKLRDKVHQLGLNSDNLSASDVIKQITSLISETKEAQEALEANLQQGRDRLIEMNSFRPAVAQELIDVIQAEDKASLLEDYMLNVFEHVGIQIEELAPRTYYLNPQGITIDAFPSIPEEGVSITFDRNRALVREEIGFLSWDHPMVTGAMDVIMGGEQGNSSFGVMADEEGTDILLETVFILETVSRNDIQIDRFLPTTPIRVLVNKAGEDLTPAYSAEVVGKRLRKGNPDKLLENSLVTQQLIPDMLDTANMLARKEADAITQSCLKTMQTRLDVEINRMKLLQQINGNVRENEIEMAVAQKKGLEEAIPNARLRLDAIRLIWQGPADMF
ncbi:MAG: RNA polymerase-associated protein RapA [Rhodothermales bacterium]